jgi:DNA ligase-4
LELKAAEITSSESFPTKLTLRFPRVLNVRFDKSVGDAMKFEEILEFYQNYQHNFLMKKKRKIENNMDELNVEGGGKELKLVRKNKKYSRVLEEFKDTETNNVNNLI